MIILVCFLILHYRVFEETRNCINSILNNVVGEKKIIVVDNCSPNDSYVELVKTYKNNEIVDVIQTDSNLGFANGNNFGYDYILSKYSPDFIVVMNNDMEIIQSDFIEKIEQAYKETSFSVLGPDIFSTKGNYHQNPQKRVFPTYDQLLKSRKELRLRLRLRLLLRFKTLLNRKKSECSLQTNQTKENNILFNCYLHGSCYILSSKFINRYPKKCFYDKTFMYMEAEIFYYQHLRNLDLMVYYPNIVINHHEDVSTNASYSAGYRKTIFTIKCLYQSTDAFIKLMESDMVKDNEK